MRPDLPDIRRFSDELHHVLDEEIRLLHERTRQFDELYDAILHRHNERMETLLGEMTATQQEQAKVDTSLDALRQLFAKSLRCRPAEIKLSELADHVDHPDGVLHKREQIILLSEALKKKHLRTAVLLTECSRINRALLDGLLPENEPSLTTYGHEGSNPWRANTGLVDAEF
jgi:hypothetical protein